MQLATTVQGAAIALCLAAAVPSASAQTLQPVGPYTAVVDRVPYPKPALPAIGAAGSVVNDPVFQSRILRVTDGATRPGVPNRSYRTPSSPHQNAWSANGTHFYVVSNDGSVIPFTFDAASGTAARLGATTSGSGGTILNFYIEPQFSYVSDSLIYGSSNASTGRTIDQYDFSSQTYTRLLDLDTVTAGLSGTYIGGIGSSAGSPERIMTFYGGTSQDHHHFALVFDKDNPQNRSIVDTWASTVNGAPTNITLNFSLHHVAIDRTGRYVMLYTTSADQTSARHAAQEYLWDTSTNAFTELGVSALPYGHDSMGYGTLVNQDCCTSTTWDAGQWQFRNLSAPLATHDLITPIQSSKEVYLDSHSTWNNARPDAIVPFVSGLYRYGTNTAPWRAWDDEIVAVQTDAPAGTGATVWRFAHHRSNVTSDLNSTYTSFWYEPRPNVSHDGRWVLFTSNWEKTLGLDPAGDSATLYRQDVFLVALQGTGSSGTTTVAQPTQPSPAASKPLMWIDTPGGGTVTQPFRIGGWALDRGAVSNAGVDALDVWAYPNPGSNTPPRYLGRAAYGGARPDLAAAFGGQFLDSGYGLTVSGLAPGAYQIAVFAHSAVTGTFNNVHTVNVTVVVAPSKMVVDTPANGQTVGTSFMVAGWAFDPNAASGSGVDTVHVWAYPNPGSGAPAQFVGVAAVGYSRPDVAAIFGPCGASSGYGLSAQLPAGVYDLVVFAHSAVTGTFNNAQTVRVTVR